MCSNDEEICNNGYSPPRSIDLDQASNVYYLCDPKALVYAKHLDSISEERDIAHMRLSLNELKHKTAPRVPITLYTSPNTVTRNLVRFMCVIAITSYQQVVISVPNFIPVLDHWLGDCGTSGPCYSGQQQ